MPPSTSTHLRRLLLFSKAFAGVLGLKILLSDNVLTLAPINGVSMQPSLSPEYTTTSKQRDLVLFKRWGARDNVQRGDVAQFMSPNYPEQFAVKRVIGLPGDTVILDKRRRPEVKEGPEPTAARAWDSLDGRITVPPGHVWVEGDNWRKSSDSNWYGPVSKSLITGKAVAVLWPVDRFWQRPWEGWKGKTKIVEGSGVGGRDWTGEGLPVEIAEVGDLGLPRG